MTDSIKIFLASCLVEPVQNYMREAVSRSSLNLTWCSRAIDLADSRIVDVALKQLYSFAAPNTEHLLWLRGGGWSCDVEMSGEQHFQLFVNTGIRKIVWSDSSPKCAEIPWSLPPAVAVSARIATDSAFRTVTSTLPPSRARESKLGFTAVWDIESGSRALEVDRALKSADVDFQSQVWCHVQARIHTGAWDLIVPYPTVLQPFHRCPLHLGVLCVS